jgi:molybdate transport system substrate-binding protein
VRIALAALVVIAATGCGGSARNGPTIFAASSLTDVFSKLDGDASYNFGGSDALAFQIEQGAPADVFASASPAETEALREKGLIERPRVFAHNRLVVIVPRDNPAGVGSWRDLARKDVSLVLAAPSVPAGDYARTALARLGITPGSVVSEEPDVRGVLTKVSLGGADAGIVYRTDARAGADHVREIPLPAHAQPNIDYTIAATVEAPSPDRASEFIDLVLGTDGRAALSNAGFELP